MQAFIIYDNAGKIWNIIYGENTMPENLKCIEVEIPEGAGVDDVDLSGETPQPRIIWQVAETRSDMLEEIVTQAKTGRSIKELIASLDLTDAEKWKLEKEVKEVLEDGI